jgi:hypothetical protein
MSTPVEPAGQPAERRAAWARPIKKLTVPQAPPGAVNLNVEGRSLAGALQGFGPLWQKTYRVRLPGLQMTPAEVMRVWKENFPAFQPPDTRFFPTLKTIAPGEVLLINLRVQGLPIDGGVMVVYADDESFTVMTPVGFMEAGWNTFSVYEEDGVVVAQVQSLARTSDPIYEFGFRLAGSRAQEQNWVHVLTNLARHLGINAQPSVAVSCVDPSFQWSQAKNVIYNGGVRSVFYGLAAPARWLVRQARRRR